MMRALGKTIGRTRYFLGDALARREPERQHAPVAWGLIAGWIWLLTSLPGNPAWFQLTLSAVYLSGVLAAVCAIDARHGIVPDSLVVALAFGGFFNSVFTSQPDWPQRVLEAGLFFLAACLFRTGYRRVRGYHGLGFGDVKFAAVGVLWIGIEAAPHLLVVSVLSALASLLILKAGGYSLNRQTSISFGPHLSIGLWLSWILVALQPGF